ncbi:subtilisin inhibitor [Cunninghamella echinulata]|nr:subtilisin inhibitor [Cunninghamella echinulata]
MMKYCGLYILLFSFFIVLNASPISLSASKEPIRSRTYFKFTSTHQDIMKKSILICDRNPHGSHPNPAESCKDIFRYKGNLSVALSQGKQDCICTMIYDPVSISIVGKYKGESFNFSQTFGNACELSCKIDKVQNFFNI